MDLLIDETGKTVSMVYPFELDWQSLETTSPIVQVFYRYPLPETVEVPESENTILSVKKPSLPRKERIQAIDTKQQYLDRLRRIFKANKEIEVRYSDFLIRRHPTRPGIYGVSVRQAYSSDLYSDEGYLFLLWDFSDETAPKIHVRTWQPRRIDDQTLLPERDIIHLGSFNFE